MIWIVWVLVGVVLLVALGATVARDLGAEYDGHDSEGWG